MTQVEPSQRYYQHESAITGALVRTQPSSPAPHPDIRNQGNFDGGDGTILPSIEGPDGSYLPPRTRRNPFEKESDLRETNIARHGRHDPRDLGIIDLTNTSSQTPKRRRLDEGAPPPPGAYLPRRDSPGRPMERQYLPQVRLGQADLRLLDYDEQHYSPRPQQASALGEHPYADRQPHYEFREAPPTVTRVYEPVPVSQDMMEGRPPYRAQNYGVVRHNDIDAYRVEPPRYEPLSHTSRSYEPAAESRAYDGRPSRENFMPVREQHVQPTMQEARVRYIYADGTDAREPLRTLPPQRIVEYDQSGAQLRSYAR